MTSNSSTPAIPFRLAAQCGRLFILCLAVGCLLILLQSPGLAKTDDASGNADSEAMPQWIKPPEFEYTSRGKPDPFQSFIRQTQPAQESQEQEAEEPKRPLTPLERVQPSQLSLEGILVSEQSAGDAFALVRLPDGKGYVLKKGTRIGRRRGRVVQITPNQVVIREQVQTIYGEEEQNDVVLKLHKSGEENE